MRPLLILAALAGLPAAAQTLTPEDLRAQIDAMTANTDPFQTMLNDPDPARSLAAVQLMLDSGEPGLMRMAVDFGLQSAVPEVRRAAVMGFLRTQPTLQMQMTVPEDAVEAFDPYFRRATDGSMLADGTAIYSVNVGPFDAEKNCFPRTGTDLCAVEVGPVGLTVRPAFSSYAAVSNLVFTPEGNLTGSTSVASFDGGFPTTLVIAD